MGLLDEISLNSGCCYLSDLRLRFKQGQDIQTVVRAVRQVKSASYSIDEWREAFQYITDQTPKAETVYACRASLVELLNERKKSTLHN